MTVKYHNLTQLIRGVQAKVLSRATPKGKRTILFKDVKLILNRILFWFSVQINKLRSVNMKLRNKLKELNTLLQKQIERKGSPSRKSGSPSPDRQASEAYQIRIKEQELANVHKQTEIYRKELETLKLKIGNGPNGSSVSGVHRLLELE